MAVRLVGSYSLKTAMVVFLPVLVNACQSAPRELTSVGSASSWHFYHLNEKELLAVQNGVQPLLKDPASARFGLVAASVDNRGTVTVCGWVNAKNSFGGYTGEQPFMGLLAEGEEAIVFVPAKVGGERPEQQAILHVCAVHGISF
jgi:hypothetical protein